MSGDEQVVVPPGHDRELPGQFTPVHSYPFVRATRKTQQTKENETRARVNLAENESSADPNDVGNVLRALRLGQLPDADPQGDQDQGRNDESATEMGLPPHRGAGPNQRWTIGQAEWPGRLGHRTGADHNERQSGSHAELLENHNAPNSGSGRLGRDTRHAHQKAAKSIRVSPASMKIVDGVSVTARSKNRRRFYEGATEKLHASKFRMFNVGDEMSIFKKYDFNAVFYSEVIAGSHMPNLMYMTTFNSKADRDKHWDTFSNDPEWKTLVAKKEYQNNVSKADILFLHPTAYSDF